VESLTAFLTMWASLLQYDLREAYGSDAWSVQSGSGPPSVLAARSRRSQSQQAAPMLSGEYCGLQSTSDQDYLLVAPNLEEDGPGCLQIG
jgi:hypothetical protein